MGGATESGFQARAGALTLLWVAGAMDRAGLLELLEADLAGVPPPVPDEDEVAAYEEELEAEGEEVDEDDEDDLEREEALAELDPDLHEPIQLTAKGEETLYVSGAIERWLSRCPQGPLELGLAGARALAPMVCSWSMALTHALAAGPLTLEELRRSLVDFEPGHVERRLEMLVDSGQAEALHGTGQAPTYALTDWGREAVSPIVAAVRYELRYPEENILPPDVFDVEAAFQMALPLIRVPADVSGTVRAGVRIADPEAEEDDLVVGSTVEVADGRVTASSPLLERAPETWATGTPLDWCETVTDPAEAKLDLGGDVALAQGLVEALHERLFGSLVS